jgi:hypothetical protein
MMPAVMAMQLSVDISFGTSMLRVMSGSLSITMYSSSASVLRSSASAGRPKR